MGNKMIKNEIIKREKYTNRLVVVAPLIFTAFLTKSMLLMR